MNTLFINMQYICTKKFLESIKKDGPQKNIEVWEITNEIKPIDLYCYLTAKFGSPNGLLTLLKNNSSDNLIHWDWIFASDLGYISIQGHNFRTEIHVSENVSKSGLTLNDFISQIKSDFKNHGKEISKVKNNLEKWTEFINPFTRLQDTIRLLFGKLDELNLNPTDDKIASPLQHSDDPEKIKKLWKDRSDRYSFATGIVYGIRSMLPVMAESFINLLIFVLCKPDIKNNTRLFNSILRNQIDIRIQSLHLYCSGFTKSIDYNSDECKKFHTLINERNDLLHGNINIDKQGYSDVYFDKRTPIFIKYQDFWEKAIGVSLASVKYETIYDDMLVVENFIGYILERLDNKTRFLVEELMMNMRLGFNHENGKIGVLFPKSLADFRGTKKKEEI
ncbi:hypothetical protein [Acinetobacter courvalinii]|uniref:hypothetical protein n=1 Tax=Acinetobacter courvalinii TaxID=280147 RepID=UPI00289742E9|nr:hypothetical protein [Acinetobacter courvalinii]